MEVVKLQERYNIKDIPLNNFLTNKLSQQMKKISSVVQDKSDNKHVSIALKDLFGHDTFKSEVQANAVRAVLKGYFHTLSGFFNYVNSVRIP